MELSKTLKKQSKNMALLLVTFSVAMSSATAYIGTTGVRRSSLITPLKLANKNNDGFGPTLGGIPKAAARPVISVKEAFSPAQPNGRLIAGLVLANVAIVCSGLSMGYVAQIDVFSAGNCHPDVPCAAVTASLMLGSVALCLAKDVPAITNAYIDTQVGKKRGDYFL